MEADLPSADVERIRISAERAAYARLEREERRAHLPHVPEDGAARRRELLSNAMLLTDTMAPDAYAAARDAMASLGVDDTIELFQSAGRGVDTARLVLYGNPIGVELIGGYLGGLDRGSFLAVLGHEIGHCIAHTNNATFRWAFGVSQSGASASKRAYAMAAELTADRFGLLASGDLDAVLRLEMHTSAGRSGIRLDTDSYVRQCRVVAEEIIVRGGVVAGTTHPEHYVRGYAEWLFSETDVYASITGRGPGSRAIEDVDAVLHDLLGLRTSPVPLASAAATSQVLSSSANAQDAALLGPRARAAVKGAIPQPTLEDLATRILTDAVRRKAVATSEAFATFARAAIPSLERVAHAAREQLSGAVADERPPKQDTAPDPLQDDRRDLLARFEKLERRSKAK